MAENVTSDCRPASRRPSASAYRRSASKPPPNGYGSPAGQRLPQVRRKPDVRIADRQPRPSTEFGSVPPLLVLSGSMMTVCTRQYAATSFDASGRGGGSQAEQGCCDDVSRVHVLFVRAQSLRLGISWMDGCTAVGNNRMGAGREQHNAGNARRRLSLWSGTVPCTSRSRPAFAVQLHHVHQEGDSPSSGLSRRL